MRGGPIVVARCPRPLTKGLRDPRPTKTRPSVHSRRLSSCDEMSTEPSYRGERNLGK